jgi:2'-5' RNA ligase
LFFALWPDDDARAHIAKAALALRLAVDARPVPQENFHTTLAFVGEVSTPQLTVLQQIGRAQRAAACAIRFDAYDYWLDPQVVVAVARESPASLTLLWAQLHRDLALQLPQLNLKYAYHAREEGRASPCAASNVSLRLDCAIIQSGTLRYQRRTLCLYSSRYLATTV